MIKTVSGEIWCVGHKGRTMELTVADLTRRLVPASVRAHVLASLEAERLGPFSVGDSVANGRIHMIKSLMLGVLVAAASLTVPDVQHFRFA
jgi:hypothetical protein